MVNKRKSIVVCCTVVAALLTSSGMVMADDTKGRLSIIYSPHKTYLSAPEYLAGLGQIPKDHENSGDDYWGLMGEVNFGKFSLSVDYLTGTSDEIEGGADLSTPSTFNPLTYEASDTLDLVVGYNVLDNPIIGKMDVTLGYFRMWASPTISPPNWYDGPEIGIKGRRSWDGGYAIIYKVGYLPTVSVHGYMEDFNLMTGKDIWNCKFGAEIPVYKSMSAVGGYMWTRAENEVVADGSAAVVEFSGFYIGGMHSF